MFMPRVFTKNGEDNDEEFTYQDDQEDDNYTNGGDEIFSG